MKYYLRMLGRASLLLTMGAGAILVVGCSSADFFAQCKDALNDRYCALFEEHEHHWFVDALLACLDYSHFFSLMVAECRKKSSSRRK